MGGGKGSKDGNGKTGGSEEDGMEGSKWIGKSGIMMGGGQGKEIGKGMGSQADRKEGDKHDQQGNNRSGKDATMMESNMGKRDVKGKEHQTGTVSVRLMNGEEHTLSFTLSDNVGSLRAQLLATLATPATPAIDIKFVAENGSILQTESMLQEVGCVDGARLQGVIIGEPLIYEKICKTSEYDLGNLPSGAFGPEDSDYIHETLEFPSGLMPGAPVTRWYIKKHVEFEDSGQGYRAQRAQFYSLAQGTVLSVGEMEASAITIKWEQLINSGLQHWNQQECREMESTGLVGITWNVANYALSAVPKIFQFGTGDNGNGWRQSSFSHTVVPEDVLRALEEK